MISSILFFNNFSVSYWQKPYEDLTIEILKDYHVEQTVTKGNLKANLFVKD